MEESQELEKLPRVVTSVLKVILSFSLIALALVLIIALAKITYTLAIMVFNTSSVVPYDVAEQAVMFFLYFGFIGLIVQYFKSGYHFPLRYFIYAGITAMLRLIIVNHESSVDTISFHSRSYHVDRYQGEQPIQFSKFYEFPLLLIL